MFSTNWEFGLDSMSGLNSFFDSAVANANVSPGGSSISHAASSTYSPESDTSMTSPIEGMRQHVQQHANGGMKQQQQQKQQSPVTKTRTGPGRHPRVRKEPENLFNQISQQRPPPPPAMMSHPMGFVGPTSPYMAGGMDMSGGSPHMMAAAAAAGMDPYAWMAAGRQRRPTTFYGQGSPSLLYNGYAQQQMPSPPFGYQHPGMMYPMYAQPAMKLPVQALHRPAEPQAASQVAGIGFMAPLMLPSDLINNAAKARSGSLVGGGECLNSDAVDAAAIPNAIASYLENSECMGKDMDTMKRFEATFRAFVKEEAALDYSNVTVVELKRLLRKYHMLAQGKKDDLISMVQRVSAFLKMLPIFEKSKKEDASGNAEEAKTSHEEEQLESPEKQARVSNNGSAPNSAEHIQVANMAEGNKDQDNSLDRFLV